MLQFEWVHLSWGEAPRFVETYGFSGNQGTINLEGVLIRPQGTISRTLLIFMHPASTLQLLPIPREAARMGAHVLCAGSRYARNDTAAILENVLLDLSYYVYHAKTFWGYEHVVLAGWSGGGSLALFYQSQAENPTISHTPAGDPVAIISTAPAPVDAVIFQAAHISRAQLLLEMIDPSILNEHEPDTRDVSLDIYDPAASGSPPYSTEFIQGYRAAQLARVRRITANVKQTLAALSASDSAELERGFVVHRTLADPRFLDPSIDPNERAVNWCYLGHPETANSGPAGLARFSTLRSWLSQWSIDDSNADGLRCVKSIRAPLLVIENGADDAVPQYHCGAIFDAATSTDKSFFLIRGATHYYSKQPELLAQATRIILDWLAEREMFV